MNCCANMVRRSNIKFKKITESVLYLLPILFIYEIQIFCISIWTAYFIFLQYNTSPIYWFAYQTKSNLTFI